MNTPKLILSKHSNHEAPTEIFTESLTTLANTTIGNDSASSLIVIGGRVVLYSHTDYSGASNLLKYNEDIADHRLFPGNHDNLESFQLVPNNGICLFPEENYKGKMQYISDQETAPTLNFLPKSAIVTTGEWELEDDKATRSFVVGDYPQLELSRIPDIFRSKSNVDVKFISRSKNTAQPVTTTGTPSVQFKDDRAVEIIIDASGSMGNGAGSRMEVCKNSFSEILDDSISENTQVAIRIFGPQFSNHKGETHVNNCAYSSLIRELAPLGNDKENTKQMIKNISASGNTPLAASVAASKEDLKNATGKKIVVLLTDGEETCGGDLKKVVTELCADPNFKIVLNIVGIDLKSEETKRNFQDISNISGGKYIDVSNINDLKEAIQEAVSARIFIYHDYDPTIEAQLDGPAVQLIKGDKYKYRINDENSPIVHDLIYNNNHEVIIDIN